MSKSRKFLKWHILTAGFLCRETGKMFWKYGDITTSFGSHNSTHQSRLQKQHCLRFKGTVNITSTVPFKEWIMIAIFYWNVNFQSTNSCFKNNRKGRSALNFFLCVHVIYGKVDTDYKVLGSGEGLIFKLHLSIGFIRKQTNNTKPQIDIQIYRQMYWYTDICTDIQTDIHIYKQMYRYIDSKTKRYKCIQTYVQIYRQIYIYTNRCTDI